ncbi:DUF3667 domain-containing protein [Chitinophaga sp. MM2321]|uniref:DUF3667 domain-containing protein n=1 Tax=Chitinophaga sp. MM2321 TaxID=3137178 RepID=UPI0032D5A3A3
MQPLRTDKHCLNCGTEVPERFCTHCGQENTIQHETFGHLLKHFTADILHYDSQFLSTLKYLLFRPGFLTKEYLAGRRVKYVNPIKLYVFISFVFFLGFFAFYANDVVELNTGQDETESAAEKPLFKTKVLNDSLRLIATPEAAKKAVANDSSEAARKLSGLSDDIGRYKSVAAYDSAQLKLPPANRATGSEKFLTRRMIELEQKYRGDKQKALVEMFRHNLPKLMFLLLPLFALFVKMIYDKKRWLYVDHAIFAIHIHAFAFILLLLGAILQYYFHKPPFMDIASWIIFGYLVLALRNTYHQSFGKSLLKGILLTVSYGISTIIAFLVLLALIFGIFL